MKRTNDVVATSETESVSHRCREQKRFLSFVGGASLQNKEYWMEAGVNIFRRTGKRDWFEYRASLIFISGTRDYRATLPPIGIRVDEEDAKRTDGETESVIKLEGYHRHLPLRE